MLKRKYAHWVLLLLVAAVAAFIRLYRLHQIPPGVNRDEASIGYTAYSLLKTGKDEYGRPYPLSFESFGDWKLPFYIYETIPFIKLFGLTELSVRLPSAMAGIITVVMTFFLVRQLFSGIIVSEVLPLLSAFFLAISPWSVHLSRVGSESNTAVLMVTIAVFLWLKALRGKSIYFIFSFPLLSLTFFTYAGNHIFSSLLFFGLIVLSRKSIRSDKYALIGIGIFAFFLIIIFSQTLFSADKIKISGISIFGDPAIIHSAIELPRVQHSNPSSLYVRLVHNRITFAGETIFRNYIKAFSPEFLFIRGGTNHAHNIENFGNLYLAEVPFFYLGIVVLLLNSKKFPFNLLLWWLAIAPVAASITKDAPHTTRMFAIYPLPPVLCALGLLWIKDQIYNKVLKKITIIGIMILYSVSILIYLDRYFIHFPMNESANWGVGFEKLTRLLNSTEYKDKKVIISRPEISPYIYLLFYSRYNPALYQLEAKRYPQTSDGFTHVAGFGRFEFRDINWDMDIYKTGTILVDIIDPQRPSIYHGANIISQPNGLPYIQIVSTK